MNLSRKNLCRISWTLPLFWFGFMFLNELKIPDWLWLGALVALILADIYISKRLKTLPLGGEDLADWRKTRLRGKTFFLLTVLGRTLIGGALFLTLFAVYKFLVGETAAGILEPRLIVMIILSAFLLPFGATRIWDLNEEKFAESEAPAVA